MSSEIQAPFLFLLFLPLHLRAIFKTPSQSKMAVKLHHHVWWLTGSRRKEGRVVLGQKGCSSLSEAFPEFAHNTSSWILLLGLVTWPCLAAKLSALPAQIKSGFDYEGRWGERIFEWVSHQAQIPISTKGKESPREVRALTHSHVASVRAGIFIWFLIFPWYGVPSHLSTSSHRSTGPDSPSPAGVRVRLGLSVPTTLL